MSNGFFSNWDPRTIIERIIIERTIIEWIFIESNDLDILSKPIKMQTIIESTFLSNQHFYRKSHFSLDRTQEQDPITQIINKWEYSAI